jgi:hypothetical protein
MNIPQIHRKYFFDFYLATELWWKYGSGRNAYGFEHVNFLSYDKSFKLNEFCEKTIRNTKEYILKELFFCISSEVKHSYDKDEYCFGTSSFCQIKNLKPTKKIKPFLKIKINEKNIWAKLHPNTDIRIYEYFKFLNSLNPNLPQIKLIFKGGYYRQKDLVFLEQNNQDYKWLVDINNFKISSKIQKEEFSILKNYLSVKDKKTFITRAQKIFSFDYLWWDYYGGSSWKKACELWLLLYKSNSLKDDVYYIDLIYDLQHNTGFIFEKEGCSFYENTDDDFWKIILDMRSKFKSEAEYFPCVSFTGKKYCLNYTKSLTNN